jgi:hypothetical protein
MNIDAIIFLHWGNPDYLRCAVERAKKSNPDQRIILIGDDSNSHLKNAVEHYSASNFSTAGAIFRERYIHLSANESTYESRCIERWFIVAQLMKTLGLQNVMHADSDVLIYGSMDQTARNMGDFDLSLSYRTCAHASFWNLDAIEKFCGYVNLLYLDNVPYLRQVFDKFVEGGGSAGGICDMTLLGWFAERGDLRLRETTDVWSGSTFDHNINMAEHGSRRFEMCGRGKELTWIENVPYGREQKTGELIRFELLHFQGFAKTQMSRINEEGGQIFDPVLFNS